MIHRPVLLQEALDSLAPASGGLYLDGTIGMGGHASAILEASSPDGRLIGFECDQAAFALAAERLAPYGERVRLLHGSYAEALATLRDLGLAGQVDGLLVDLGLSSFQLDKSGRGFSFKGDEPLDMRMDTRLQHTAADIVNDAPEEELADIFYHYGEERQARRIAAHIAAARKQERIETSGRLAEIVAAAVPRPFHPKKIHVATKVFQALRMATNRELENIDRILDDGVEILKIGGRFCAISFHSLEDRLVKRKFRDNPRYEPLTAKPIVPGEEECSTNPRARSAKLRVASRVF